MYETPTNWSASVVPPPENDVIFGFPGSYGVGFQQDHTSENLTVTFESHPTFSIAGDPSNRLYTISGAARIEDRASLTLDSGTTTGTRIHLETGPVALNGDQTPSAGLLTLRGGSRLTSSSADLGELVNSIGRAHLTGDETEWQFGSDIFVGLEGGAELTIDAGANMAGEAVVTALGESSSATVNVVGVGTDGMPSTLAATDRLVLGKSGDAQLNILGGAAVSAGIVKIAENSASQSSLLVSGTDAAGNPSTVTTGNMETAFFGGSADVRVEGGARMFSDNASLHRAGVEIHGSAGANSPSSWSVAGQLNVDSHVGLLIQDGAHLATQSAYISAFNLGNALISLNSSAGSPGSTWENSGDVSVGSGGFGHLQFDSGSQVNIGGILTIEDEALITVTDSVLAADRIIHTAGGDLSFDAGEIQFNRFDGDLENTSGRVGPGIDGQAATLVGNYTQAAGGTLALEIGGAAGLTDFLTVSGTTDLDGILELSLINGFTPGPSDTFDVLFTTNLVGLFDNVTNGQRLTTSDGRGSFVVNYGLGSAFDATSIVLSDFLAEMLAADFNGDGAVNCADVDALVADIAAGSHTDLYDLTGEGNVNHDDLTVWLAQAGSINLPSGNSYLEGDANLDGLVDGLDFIEWNANKFTETAAWCSGDFTADGFVDGLDFIIWNANKFTSADGVSAVPEPTAITLVVMLLGGLIIRTRQSN